MDEKTTLLPTQGIVRTDGLHADRVREREREGERAEREKERERFS